MSHMHLHKPHLPDHDVPREHEPGSPPVEPDEGPVPGTIPQDPEQERAPGPRSDPILPMHLIPMPGRACLNAANAGLRNVVGRSPTSQLRTANAKGSPGVGPAFSFASNEATETPSRAQDPLMSKPRRDVAADFVDADMRAIASLDAKIRACLVPGPCRKAPVSNG